MFLLALAGGATAPAGEDILGCCGGFIIMPAVVLLILVAWVADSPWAGWTALAVAGLTYLVASLERFPSGWRDPSEPEARATVSPRAVP